MDDFAERLRQLREDQRPVRTRKVTSHLCGLHTNAISRYERREAKPDMEALIKIADYYDVPIDYLLGRTDYKFRWSLLADVLDKLFGLKNFSKKP